MKLHKTTEPEVYYYFNSNGEKLWMYRHKYYDDTGRRKEKKKSGFNTEKQAVKALLEVKVAIMRGETKQVEYDQLTVGAWLDMWYENYSHSWEISTRTIRKRVIENRMKPLIGRFNLSKLDRTTYMREYIKPMLNTLKPSTVSTYHNYFKIAINAAVEEEILLRNRFKKVSIEQKDKRKNFLTADELNILLSAVKKHTTVTGYTLTLLLAYTGMRIGEALGLKWADVNFKTKEITVNCTRDSHGERTPKTRNSYRTIPVDEILINQLLSYQKWCVETKFRFGYKLDKSADHIFISNRGATKIFSEVMKIALRNSYLKLKEENINITRISPHGLRHTHATILINNGVPPKTIADRLGNTVEMVYKVYGHSFKELENKAVTVFSESLIGAKTGAD